MPLKLKLKVKPSSSPVKEEPDTERPLPRLKIKQPTLNKEHSSVTKPPKEKLKKLKISLGKVSTPTASSHEPHGHVQPVPRKVPKVRIKPTRVPGEGYDSEAPDVEDDPLIEQAIAVRFANDANLDFLHSAADTGDFSNVNIKWITRDKAVVNVNSTLYSARLIDLPTLTELYKTVDKKNIFKTIDVSQILLVLRTINPKHLNMETDFEVPDEYTYTHPLYKLSVNKEIRASKTAYRHGLSNSFDDVYRRFRPKKVNHRLMVDIESRVDEIVRRDNEAQESHYEYVNPKNHPRYADSRVAENQPFPGVSTDIGEIPEPGATEENVDEDDQMALDLEADLDIALEQELADALDSTSNNTAATVLMKSEYDNDDIDEGAGTGANDDDEGEDEEDDDDEDEDDEEDEDIKQDKSLVKKLEEEISDLQSAADKQKVLLATASYKMMRMKFQSAYNNLKAQLDSKKRELAKIRESQNKVDGVQNREVVEEEEDEEMEEMEEDEPDVQEDNGEEIVGNGGLDGEGYVEGEGGEGNEDENYDDFQGLF